MDHSDGDGLHLNGLWFLEGQLEQVLEQCLIGALDFLPFADGVGCLAPTDVYLMVLPENPPISILHFLEWFGLPGLL